MAVGTDQVWRTLDKQSFMVLGLVNRRGQGRSVGVVPTVHEKALWFAASSHDWKLHHIRHQPEVSVTVPVRRGGILAIVAPIPPATITFQATAAPVQLELVPEPVRRHLLRGLSEPESTRGDLTVVRLKPYGDFVTYGVGVSLLTMRDTEAARGRAPVE